ncbi:calcium/sodium antiporter [Roseomonas alkaliterrae]|uniref:Cation:H+ antiporter n=1 Tax=Neoroseomonas alkaliterrae TaxID=1452450 RepID=A0A840Y369_9PROT|nr:calcium/sodium antiporter [Neoroseomonas alkaliterrae]MBB5688314.1 cation:H+ antiporter [Neoroseomonas alkaliterrae]MBR0677106.1 calcium/sodium antiporter [Neoroseomonas alkaliterrae]
MGGLLETTLLILGGLVLLALGGEALVRGAVQIAERLGISPLLIGLTLVGFGTSTPELVTSVQASLAGSPGIAVGNVVGSNIANVLLILGAAALIHPVRVTSAALARDGVIGAAAAAALVAAGLLWSLDRMVGAAFLAGLVAYLGFAWWQESRGTADHTAAFDKGVAFEEAHPDRLRAAPASAAGGLALSLALLLGGLALVVLGGRLLVDGAVALARAFAVEEALIGLTIVAVGTSLPELVTSAIAAMRRQADVAIGNVLGSNIYNVLGIAGATGMIAPTAIPAGIAGFDAPLMLAVSLLLLVVARTGWRIGRREGGLLLGLYAAYLWWMWPA